MNDRRRSKVFCYALIWIIFTFLLGFSSGTICEKCGLDFPQLKKHIWCCKASAMAREQPTYQVTLDVTLNHAIPHKDNQQPNGNNAVVNLSNEIRNIDDRSAIRVNKIMTISVNVIVVKFLIRIKVQMH